MDEDKMQSMEVPAEKLPGEETIVSSGEIAPVPPALSGGTVQVQPALAGEVVLPAKRLLRSRRERMLAGVCGGISRYFGVDPVLVRALWILLTLMTGVVPGVILYGVAILVMKENGEEEPTTAAPSRTLPIQSAVFWGGLLVLVGLYFLGRIVWNSVLPSSFVNTFSIAWGTMRAVGLAAALIGMGVLLIVGISRRQGGETMLRLTRARRGRMFAGVCAGLGRYFKLDPTWVRLAWVLITLISVWVGAILYFVAMVAIPEEPSS